MVDASPCREGKLALWPGTVTASTGLPVGARGGSRRRSGEVATVLWGGCARQAERRLGWGRDTVEKGLHEQRHGLRRLENFAARGRRRSEEKDPRLAIPGRRCPASARCGTSLIG
jgi:hypothetical protein